MIVANVGGVVWWGSLVSRYFVALGVCCVIVSSGPRQLWPRLAVLTLARLVSCYGRCVVS